MTIRRLTSALTVLAVLAAGLALSPAAKADVYELRTYVTHEGKLDDLHARFRDHTVGLFKKHGIESVGYWVPAEGPAAENTLIYVLRHKSREAAAESWKAFGADPQWQAARKASEADGPILARRPESVYMETTDYTPPMPAASRSNEIQGKPALYELRVYRCHEGKLKDLDKRFKDHTIGFFTKHDIESVAYWHPTDGEAAKDTLIYIIRHTSKEAADASWAAFRADEGWKAAKEASEKAGPILRESPEVTYLVPTDYSALR